MPKRHTKRKYKKNKKTRKIRSLKSKKMRGEQDQVKCSMCEKYTNKNDALIPNECLMKHGKAAHRICQDCWWDSVKGFALEGVSHKCPGCQKGLPLTYVKKEESIEIDLTDD